MRPIPLKCRGRRIDNGEWVYGYYRVTSKGLSIIYPFENTDGYVIVDPETVGQFIGLHDKKRTEGYPEGQEICEGNKVATGDGYNYIVKWSEENGGWYFEGTGKNIYDETPAVMDYRRMKAVYLRQIEVIGDIHENPELLKGGE